MADIDPVEALYVAPPKDFVGARDTLARQLREAGDNAGAARVRALRRPTRAAWALNTAVREHPDAARELTNAAALLRDAQRELLAGGPAAQLREAQARVHAAGEALAAAAPVVDPPTLEKVHATLRAAAVDASVLAEVTGGRLLREQVASGFGDLDAFAPAPESDRPRPARTDTAPTRVQKAGRRAADVKRAAREAQERATREAQERTEREAAERAAAARQERIEQAREREAAAEAAANAAQLALDEAQTLVATRLGELDAATSRLAAAREASRRAADK